DEDGRRPAGQARAGNEHHRPPRAATARTQATERAASRPASGTAGGPPAHQVTEAPANSAAATAGTADPDHAPGAEWRGAGQGGETGPNAASTERRPALPAAMSPDSAA